MKDAETLDANGVDRSFARYTSFAILLHWSIAALIFYQFFVGYFVFTDFESLGMEERRALYDAIQDHKAIGLSVLALTVLRLAWRLARPAPPLPPKTPRWQRAASHGSHVLLYGFMIAAPLSGWAMVSSSVAYGALPTTWFGLFEIPHLPLARVELMDNAAHAAHSAITFLMGLLLLVHVVAALKHHVVDGDAVLARMTPGVKARRGALEAPLGWTGLGAGLGALVLVAGGAAGAALFAAANAPGGDEAAATDLEPMEAAATYWAVDHAQSRLGFSGSYFNGDFDVEWTSWTAEIAFDPERLDESRVRIVIDSSSGRSSDGDVESNLTAADYFAPESHPHIVFASDDIVPAEGADAYVARGALTIRGQSHPVALPFTARIDGDTATAQGEVVLDRLVWGLGPSATDMSAIQPEIRVVLSINAARAEAPPPGSQTLVAPNSESAGGATPPEAETATATNVSTGVAQWRVLSDESHLRYTGDYGLGAFSGAFARWTADIAFSADMLEASSIRVDVEIDSVSAGDVQIEGSVRGADYLNVAEHPTAVFVSESIRRGEGENAFIADGALTLVGVTHPLSLSFTLDVDGERAEAIATASLDRTIFGIGPPANDQLGIDEIITLDIRVVAERM